MIYNKKLFYESVLGDSDEKIGIAEEAEYMIEEFGSALDNDNGSRLVRLPSVSRIFHGNSLGSRPSLKFFMETLSL